MNKEPMTAQGAELLKNELTHLKTVERPAIIAAIAEARAHGDLKENAEYHAAKERQALIEGRIKYIENKLSHAHIIDIKTLPKTGRVVFGVIVLLCHQETEVRVSYQIVGDDEADVKRNKISIRSPIARALIGKEKGDEVSVQTPGGEIFYDILDVLYSKEDS